MCCKGADENDTENVRKYFKIDSCFQHFLYGICVIYT